ncbi:hypothetical protein D3C87_2049760 [compost metagenome]
MGFRTLEIADGWAERELYVCVRNQQQLPLYAQKLLLHFQTYAEEAKNAAFRGAAIVKI